MMKMWAAQLGLFLLALCFISSQVVQAQNSTDAPMNTTMMNGTMTTSSMNSTIGDKNSGGRIDSFTLLLPLAVAASLLHGCSQ